MFTKGPERPVMRPELYTSVSAKYAGTRLTNASAKVLSEQEINYYKLHGQVFTLLSPQEKQNRYHSKLIIVDLGVLNSPLRAVGITADSSGNLGLLLESQKLPNSIEFLKKIILEQRAEGLGIGIDNRHQPHYHRRIHHHPHHQRRELPYTVTLEPIW